MLGRINFHPAVPLYERPGMIFVLTPLVIAGYDTFVQPPDMGADRGWQIRVSRAEHNEVFRVREDATKVDWQDAVAAYLRERP